MESVFKRWRCLIALVVVIVAVVVAAIGALIFAPDKVRVLLTMIGGGATQLAKVLPPTLPPATKVEKAYWLSQNWPARDRYWFHHMTQGTATFPVPYAWFLALERPELTLFSYPGYVKDEDYLRRFGFIPSPSPDTLKRGAAKFGYHGEGPPSAHDVSARDRETVYPENVDELPVGFAKLKKGTDPTSGKEYPNQLGFTCAACHTGHIEYKNVSVRFDGGGAMINLGELEKAVGLAIAYTLRVPFRFDRFADQVAKADSRWSDKTRLKEEMQSALEKMRTQIDWENEILERTKLEHFEEGFGRLDALNRIGNQVFFEDMLPSGGRARAQTAPSDPTTEESTENLPEHLAPNFARRDAPVSFPPLWNVPWFLWAQYDASISAELIRNAGEALGVNSKLNLTTHSNESLPLFRSSVEMRNIYWAERMLRGADPFAGDKAPEFKGLIAPKWSEAAEIFRGDPAWQIDPMKVKEGRKLYRELCVECHRGPVKDPEFDSEWPDDSFWQKEKNWITIGDRAYFNVVQKPVAHMGTDRQQARVLTERQVKLPPALGIKPVDDLNARWDCNLPKDEALNASFALALMVVVDKVIDQWFKDNPTASDVERDMRGTRRNCQNLRVFRTAPPVDAATAKPDIVVAVPHYRARPLDGVWATAPYLHNGSVPTLQDMLRPQDERPKVFCVGSREFDPGKVGLKATDGEACGAGLTRFDGIQLGNSNLGHSFEGTETDKRKLPLGVIGRELKRDERDALVEYLKTL